MFLTEKHQSAARLMLSALLCACLLLFSSEALAKRKAPAAPPPPAWYADRDRAVQLARQGDNNDAAISLQALYQQHPNDVGLTRDYLSVLSWMGGHDEEVIRLYQTLPTPDQPDYVLAAVAHSYRALHKPNEALGIYQIVLTRSPDNEVFAASIVRTLTEAGYAENAIEQADYNLGRYGNRLEVLLAAGDAADQFNQTYKALQYYENAVQISPQNVEALQGLIRAEDQIGAPQLALQLADEHPGIIQADEYQIGRAHV